MPIRFHANASLPAIFEGPCVVEEADALLEWLRRTPTPAADLGACTELHTALAQLLMAARVKLVVPPVDRLLADCLGLDEPMAVMPTEVTLPSKPRRRARQPVRGIASTSDVQVTP